MKKILLVLAMLSAAFISLDAQKTNTSKKNKISQLQMTTDSLKSQVDHLIAVNDSLSKLNSLLLEEKIENERVIESLFPELNIDNEKVQAIIESEAMIEETDIEVYEDDSLEIRFYTTSVPDSVLIARLEALNTSIDIPYNSRVKSYMVMYSERNRTQLSRLLADAQFFFPIFEAALTEFDVPLEIKYLSIIESALKTRATSRAGAKGLWQFMPYTGRSYGLEINSYVDERMDIEKAVYAAAHYLQDAYAAFGDWSLAISSYNCGAANVQRAIAKAKSANFWDIYPYLPRETRGYLPAMIGAMYAMEYAGEYGVVPGEQFIQEPVYDIPVEKKMHFRQISEVVGVPMNVVDYLNPQYTKQVIPGDQHEYILRLPRSWAIKYEEFCPDSIAAYKADEVFRSKVIVGSDEAKYTYAGGSVHVVKKGDTLGGIAKRYGVSLSSLRSANKLRSDTIVIGQKLKIPGR